MYEQKAIHCPFITVPDVAIVQRIMISLAECRQQRSVTDLPWFRATPAACIDLLPHAPCYFLRRQTVRISCALT